jgi:hypothetical protein
MIGLGGNKLEHFPYKGLRKVADVFYFEGPLLVHYIDAKQHDYLYHWVDEDNTSTRWLTYRVDRERFKEYLLGRANFLSLLESHLSDFITVLDIDGDGTHTNIQLIDFDALPADYKPPVDAFYEVPYPEEYDSWFESTPITALQAPNSVALAREFAIYINLKPSDKRLGSSPEVPQMVDFLKNINTSYIAYSKANYEKRFAHLNDPKELKKKLKLVTKKSTLRGVDFGSGSFGVALSPDLSMDDELSLDVLNWMKTLPEQFQREIVDFDILSPTSLALLHASYTQEQIEDFLMPFLNIAKSEKYEVALADKEFNPVGKTVQSATKEAKALATAMATPEQPAEAPQEPEREVITLTIEKVKGQDIKKMSPRQIHSSILATKQVTEFPVEMSSIEWQGRGYKLRNPIELQAKFDGQRSTVSEPITNTSGEGKTTDEAIQKLKERMVREFNRLKEAFPEFMSAPDLERLNLYQQLVQQD